MITADQVQRDLRMSDSSCSDVEPDDPVLPKGNVVGAISTKRPHRRRSLSVQRTLVGNIQSAKAKAKTAAQVVGTRGRGRKPLTGAKAAAEMAFNPSQHISMRREPVLAPCKGGKKPPAPSFVPAPVPNPVTTQPSDEVVVIESDREDSPQTGAVSVPESNSLMAGQEAVKDRLIDLLHQRRLKECRAEGSTVEVATPICLHELVELTRLCPMDTVDQLAANGQEQLGYSNDRILRAAFAGIISAQLDVGAEINRLLADSADEAQLRGGLLQLRDRLESHGRITHLI